MSAVAFLTDCARWHGADMHGCICRLEDGWAECPDEARGVLDFTVSGGLVGADADRPEAAGGSAPDGAPPHPQRTSRYNDVPPPGGFTGEMCDHCGSFQVVRSGTCGTCLDCGTTTGGCS